ncbi:MAG: hypothetical protein U0401_09560 [Anaerolineae bacterium]
MATSLELAITAIRSGRKEEGRQLLNLLIQQNPNNEMAWLWMSSVVHHDEQRARCLYHVLAINPSNELARRGLQLLGIVVSDSRPVRVPRDSQPIPIQKPVAAEAFVPNIFEQSLAATATQPLTQTQPMAAPASQPAPQAERRPFRLDPKAITQELPFTPLREPFGEGARRSPSAFYPRAEASSPALAPGTPPLPGPANDAPPVNGAAHAPVESAKPVEVDDIPLPDFPPVGVSLTSPVTTEPPTEAPSVPVESKVEVGPLQNGSGVLPEGGQPVHEHRALVPLPPQPASTPPAQPAYPAPISIQETRPSQPIWITQPNIPANLPQPAPAGQTQFAAPGLNGQVTMGMPTQFLQPQPPYQAVPVNHANATMGMPVPAPQPQVDPLAALHSSATMGVPAFGQMPYQSPYPQNQVYHSSATMAMPTMTEAEARARLLASQGMLPQVDPLAALRAMANAEGQLQTGTKVVKKGTKSKKKVEEDEEEGEEVNMLAVIVFGSLSITALGGLGMLILLWVTST